MKQANGPKGLFVREERTEKTLLEVRFMNIGFLYLFLVPYFQLIDPIVKKSLLLVSPCHVGFLKENFLVKYCKSYTHACVFLD